MELLFSQERCRLWFGQVRTYGWLIGIGLLILDILLPVPATGIMAALGSVYGVVPGALAGTAGAVLAGLLGFGIGGLPKLSRYQWIVSEQEISRFKKIFDQWGGYAVIFSRALPIMPEVVSILAGLSGMSFLRFFFALVLGAFPVSLLFSWIGSNPGFFSGYGMVISIGLPLVIWYLLKKMVKI